MGYVSDVAIVLSSEDSERFASEVSGDTLDFWRSAERKTFVREDGVQCVVLLWKDIKWYKGFKEVDAIEAFLSTVPHEFLRSGEEFEDVEHQNTSDYDDFLFVEKKVVIYP